MIAFAAGFVLGVAAGHVFRDQISAGIARALTWIKARDWLRGNKED